MRQVKPRDVRKVHPGREGAKTHESVTVSALSDDGATRRSRQRFPRESGAHFSMWEHGDAVVDGSQGQWAQFMADWWSYARRDDRDDRTDERDSLLAWPASGYGWPSDEYTLRFVAALLKQTQRDLLRVSA